MWALNQRCGLRAWMCFGVLLAACSGDDTGPGTGAPLGGSGAGTGAAGMGSAGSAGMGTAGSPVAGQGGTGGTSGTGGSGGTQATDAGPEPDAATDSGPEDPCEDVAVPCTTAGTSCDGDELVTCAEDEDGCLVETRSDCTQGDTDLCDADATPPACVAGPCAGIADPCSTAGTTCDGTTLVTCAENEDGCLVETETSCTAETTCGDGDDACNRCDAELATPACIFDPCATAEGEPKANVCVTDETTCADDILVTCVDDEDGCAIAQQTDCTQATTCGAGEDEPCNVCDDEPEPPVCAFDPCVDVTECLEAGTTCRGTSLVVCEPNEDGCLIEVITDCTMGGTVSETCNPSGETPECAACAPDPSCADADEGDATCNENALETCMHVDGDACLDLVVESCGSEFTCESEACVYSGTETCGGAGGPCCVEAVLRESVSLPATFETSGAGNDYSSYRCPGFNPSFPYVAAAADLLFALDVAAGTAAQVSLVGVSGFSGTNPPNLVLLTNCADTATPAEDSCQALSRSSVGYANEGETTVRVYVAVDADGGGTVGTFGLAVDTHPIACGDGIRDGDEACDDGNIFSEDGCTPECTLEDGYECTDAHPSVCTRRPEDGVCANVQCDALPDNAPDSSVQCCTSDQRCGVSSPYLFGAGCMERDQAGVSDDECPDAVGRFFLWPPTLSGCCRPDDTCGLTAAVGAGCVERSEVWRHMEDGYGAFLYSGPFQTIACTHPD